MPQPAMMSPTIDALTACRILTQTLTLRVLDSDWLRDIVTVREIDSAIAPRVDLVGRVAIDVDGRIALI
jgi:hypothetical protein